MGGCLAERKVRPRRGVGTVETRFVDRGRRVAETYEELRPLLFSIAYRMLGSVAEAEDIVQDSFVRYHRALEQQAEIDSPKAYLSAVTTRLAIDQLRSARRETYIGEWLPEPLLTDEHAPNPSLHAEDADSLSMAFLLLLERLTPVERAVFLLHDVFDYDYDEVAEIVGKSEDNTRQLAVRARRHVDQHKPRFQASRSERDRLAARFFDAVEDGDMDGLVELLPADVVVYGDGGGHSPSFRRPIFGRNKVLRLMLAFGRHSRERGGTIRRAGINGQPGVLFLDSAGRLINVITIDIADGRVQTVRGIINQDKLRHLGPLTDLAALAREHRNR
jgi:RNA polymerase sigma-70 factor, ECF subfamily